MTSVVMNWSVQNYYIMLLMNLVLFCIFSEVAVDVCAHIAAAKQWESFPMCFHYSICNATIGKKKKHDVQKYNCSEGM